MKLPCHIVDRSEMVREFFFGPKEFILGNNLKLTVSILFQEPIIAIKKGEEILLNFKGLLPKDVVFKFDTNSGWTAIPDLHSCHFNTLVIGEFKEIGDFLKLLHGITILSNKTEVEMAYNAFTLYQEEVSRDIDNKHPDTLLKALKIAMEAKIKCERSTWAKVLQRVRKLDRQVGTSIVSNSGGRRKIKKMISKCLRSHEDYFLKGELFFIGCATRESALYFLKNL